MQIPLTQGYFAQVDPEDYEYLSQFKWMVQVNRNKQGEALYAYAIRMAPVPGQTRRRRVYMHREVAEMHGMLLEDRVIDHIDGRGLNNTSANLRSATKSQNRLNSVKRKGASRYKGVSPCKGKWTAFFGTPGKRHYLGFFDTEEEAHAAYCAAAAKYAGEFARFE